MTKYLFFAPIALFLCSFDLGEKSPESMPNYEVKKIKQDPNLPKGTGQVIFTFKNEYDQRLSPDSFSMAYNGIEQRIQSTQESKYYLGLKAGKYKFQIYYNDRYYEITTDSIDIKAGWQTGITFYFRNAYEPAVAEKPVIYFYPDTTQQVSVKLSVNGELGFTYPQYNDGWNFTADPNGTLHMNDKQYDYLFWDAETNINITKVDQRAGFLVPRDSLSVFFEEKLTAMGLSPREREDFITYWAPQMQKNETSFVHFMFTEEYDAIATIDITPKPDHLFRVFMLWDDASKMDTYNIHEQKIETVSREGFTVIEWGGARVHFLSTKQNVN